jgi:predicted Zn-dependent protease
MECNLYLGRIFTESAEYERALELLKPLVNEDKGDPKVFYYLGDLYARKGQLQESYYNLGFYYKSKRDNRNALIQFERALKNAKDDETKKKIQTIIKEKKVDNQENKQWHIQNQSPLSFDYSRVPVF